MDEKKLYAAVLFAILGGNAGSLANYVNPQARALPFTSLDAERMRRDLRDEMHGLYRIAEEEIDELHEDAIRFESGLGECIRRLPN